MAGFIEGINRGQTLLFPDRLEDWIGEDHLVRVVDLFVDELDLSSLGFVRSAAARTGRPGYHPSVLLKLFIYGYLNRIPSSRRLEREAGRNVEVMWLTGKLVPDYKTIADFRRDNGPAISGNRINGMYVKADFAYDAKTHTYRCPTGEALTYRYTTEEDGLQLRRYWTGECQSCPLRSRCTTGKERRITRWEHEHLIEAAQGRLRAASGPMTIRRSTVEHPFGTIKAWMGATHFLTRRLKNIQTEMALNVLAYNIKRLVSLVGIRRLMMELQS